MRLERSSRKEREREIEKERDREIDRDRKRERVKGKREKIVEQSRGLTPLSCFFPQGGIHTRFFFSFRGWITPLCDGKRGGECGCEMDVCR